MSEKTLKTRIQNKRGTTAEWATGTAPNFVPKDGEIVAYTDVHRIKIGDGTTKVSALPFVDKVRDVTLGGESMVNANGIVELQQTVMTIGTEQSINGIKTFENRIVFKGQSEDTYLFDCYANDGQSDTIVGVYLNTIDSANGESKGELKLGDGNAECAISLQNSYGTSGQVLTSQGAGKTPKWSSLAYISSITVTKV